MINDTSTKSIGDNFELQVAQYYEALGYKVTRNVMIEHHQIDLIASKYISGGTLYTIMIEAKYRSDNVGINDVTNFLNTAKHLLQSGSVQSAVFIYNGGISDKAQGAFYNKSGIKAISINDLQKDLFNFTESLLKTKLHYEASDIFLQYIPLSNSSNGLVGKTSDIAESILEKLDDSEFSLAVIVGDFGSGKSTIIKRVFYKQACKCLADSNEKFPIYLSLGKLLQFSDVWSFLSACLKDEQYISPPKYILESELKSGRFLILLDGFDEIHTGASPADRANYLDRLTPLITSKSPCIIATRPTYFDSFDEMKRLFISKLSKKPTLRRVQAGKLDISKLYQKIGLPSGDQFEAKSLNNIIIIDGLKDKDVLSYFENFSEEIKKSTGLSPLQLQKKLYNIYDLTDLMGRPLLLNMIVVTVIEAGMELFGDDSTKGPSSLYELYTQICVHRDYTKWGGNQVLNPDSRLLICREIASAMLEADTIEISINSLSEIIGKSKAPYFKKISSSKKSEMVARAVTDIKVCSFLSFNDTEHLRFAHKSFLEFFVAQDIIIRWQESYSSIYAAASKILNKEVIYFLGSYAREQASIGKMIELAIRSESNLEASARNLLLRIVFSSGTLLSSKNIVGGHVSDIDMFRTNSSNVNVSKVSFSNVMIRGTTFDKLKADSCNFREVNVVNAKFNESHISNPQGRIAIEDSRFHSCFLDIQGEWIVKGSNFDKCKINFKDVLFPNAAVFSGCKLIKIFSNSKLRGSGTIEFTNCEIYGDVLDRWYENSIKIQFRHSTLAGVWIDIADILSISKAVTLSSAQNIAVDECAGVIFTRDEKKILDDRIRKEFEKVCPQVRIYDVEAMQAQMAALEKSRQVNKEVIFQSYDDLIQIHRFSRHHNLENHASGFLKTILSNEILVKIL